MNSNHNHLYIDESLNTKSFPHFQKPKIVGYIGLENLKYAKTVQEMKVQFDLNLHIDKAIHKPEDRDSKLTDLLNFLAEEEKRLHFQQENSLKNSKFFCYRGLMTCIANTPYENREPWKIVAILYKGNIYLCARPTDDQIYRKLNMSPREKLCTAWGYKFEQFILSDDSELEPDPNRPVDETKEFSLVFRTKLNNHSIVYGAEMDGIWCKSPVPPYKKTDTESVIQYLSDQNYIELKTSRRIDNFHQDRTFRRFKTRKWWLQSFLVGIDTILCGFRNDRGIVEELKTYKLKDLLKMSQEFWEANICFNFLDTFFTYVKQCLMSKIEREHGREALNDLQKLPLITLLFEWEPGQPIRVNPDYSHEKDQILSESFMNKLSNNMRQSETLINK